MSLVHNDIDQEGGHIYSPQEEVVGYSQGEELDREVEAGQGTLVSDILCHNTSCIDIGPTKMCNLVCVQKNGVM